MDARRMLLALGDPTRLAVFECVLGCGGSSVYSTETGLCDAGSDRSVAVCAVKCQVPCKPSTLSHHLNALREAGLIQTEKRGREVFVRAVPEALAALSRYFARPESCCEAPLELPKETVSL